LIRVENLTKYYGTRLAVDNISFNVEKGEIVGFLGPNAAGKTTTMRILTGFLMPTNGDMSVAGYNMLSHSLEARQHIGYLPEAVPLYRDETVRSYLDFLAEIRGLDKSRRKTRIEDVVEICHLEEYVDVLIGKLSKGFRQRVGVAQAIIHDPEVLILDEPTIGVDPIQVSMTRHLIIHEGKIVAEDRIENLSSMISGSKRIRLEVEGPSEKVIESLKQIEGVHQVSYRDSHYTVECSAGQDPRSKIMETIVQGGWTLLSLESIEMSLEDIFLKLTAEEETSQ
jgi:ABC-2 type transport system ATP-binding protein